MPESESPRERADNRLLAALPIVVYDRLRPYLDRVSMGRQDVVHEPRGPIANVYFPSGCIVSPTAIMEEGWMGECPEKTGDSSLNST